jgi:hypothetical protein
MTRAVQVAIWGLSGMLVTAIAWPVPPPPSTFFGTVTVAGDPAEIGLPLTTEIGGVEFGGTITLASDGATVYAIAVSGDDAGTPEKDGGTPGEVIHFLLNGAPVTETGIWSEGTNTELDLTAQSPCSCGAPCDLILAEAISTEEILEACLSILLGAGFHVESPGRVTLRAGEVITFANDSAVEAGAELVVEINPELVCDAMLDGDMDGSNDCLDCDDGNPAISPGADEACDDGSDNDCDGAIDSEDPDCQCLPDPDEPSAFDANILEVGRSLGQFNDCDFVETISRKLVPESDFEDFFRFWMTTDPICAFDMEFTLAVPAGTNYDLYLYKWNGTSWSQLRSSSNGGAAAEVIACEGCNILCAGCGCDGCTAEGDYGVRVVRAAGAPTLCEDYVLTLEDR